MSEIFGFILGVTFLLIVVSFIEWIKKTIKRENQVTYAMQDIHANALWDYDNKNRPLDSREENFEEKLDKEASKQYFKTRESKKEEKPKQ